MIAPQSDVALADWSTLGVGGPARWFYRARFADDVLTALEWALDREITVYVLGGGSNVVIADEGIDGLVVQVAIEGVVSTDTGPHVQYSVGAGEPWDDFVAETVEANCAGLECLSGIPGSVGGTPVQNVGAYGQDVSGTITAVHVIDRIEHRVRRLTAGECGFGYRTSRFKDEDADRFVVAGVDFALTRSGPPTLTYADVVRFFESHTGGQPDLSQVRNAILQIRRRKGMVIDSDNPAKRSVGSFFVNPVVSAAHFTRIGQTLGIARDDIPHYPAGEDRVKVPAAWLIERTGFTRGLRRGPVGISPFQAQAIVNYDGASARDVLALALDVKQRVWQTFGVALIPEPVFMGFGDDPGLQWLLDPRPPLQ